VVHSSPHCSLLVLPFLPLFAMTELQVSLPLGIVLFLAACTGHTLLMVVGLNVLYAWPLPHGVLRYTRKLDILVILLGPVLFWYALGFHDGSGISFETGARRALVTPYLFVSCILGLVAAPAAVILYHCRRVPKALLSGRAQVVDVARELGYLPAGRGKKAYLARLPGNQVCQVDMSERTFLMPQLPPEWDGLSILHLSDLHLCGTPDRSFFRHVLERCKEFGELDLIAVTGDIVDSKRHHRWVVPLLGRLRARHGGFAILGNHDYWLDATLIRRRLTRAGYHVLGNGWKQIEVRGKPMVVIGNETPWFRPAADLASCPAGVFRLCLSHTPDTISWCRANLVDLMLAGHVHGGQIRLPFIGSLFVPSRFSRRYDCGSFFEPPTLMHVSRGLAGQHPLRFNCRPEVTKIVLVTGPRQLASPD